MSLETFHITTILVLALYALLITAGWIMSSLNTAKLTGVANRLEIELDNQRSLYEDQLDYTRSQLDAYRVSVTSFLVQAGEQ